MDVRFFDNSLKELSNDINLTQQRSFLYGDGHFTTAKVVDGQIELLERHIERLKQANKQLGFNPVLWHKLSQVMAQSAAHLSLGVIKVQISRGAAQRGYGQTFTAQPLIVLSQSELTQAWLEQQQAAISLPVAEFKLGIQPMLAGVKHCNRLEQVLIARELEQRDVEDALVLDIHNNVIETNKANVFWLHNNQWYTSSVNQTGVNGVMRQYLIDILHTPIVEIPYDKFIEDVEAMFICNGLIGIRPVERVANKPLSLAPVEQLRAKL